MGGARQDEAHGNERPEPGDCDLDVGVTSVG